MNYVETLKHALQPLGSPNDFGEREKLSALDILTASSYLNLLFRSYVFLWIICAFCIQIVWPGYLTGPHPCPLISLLKHSITFYSRCLYIYIFVPPALSSSWITSFQTCTGFTLQETERLRQEKFSDQRGQEGARDNTGTGDTKEHNINHRGTAGHNRLALRRRHHHPDCQHLRWSVPWGEPRAVPWGESRPIPWGSTWPVQGGKPWPVPWKQPRPGMPQFKILHTGGNHSTSQSVRTKAQIPLNSTTALYYSTVQCSLLLHSHNPRVPKIILFAFEGTKAWWFFLLKVIEWGKDKKSKVLYFFFLSSFLYINTSILLNKFKQCTLWVMHPKMQILFATKHTTLHSPLTKLK